MTPLSKYARKEREEIIEKILKNEDKIFLHLKIFEGIDPIVMTLGELFHSMNYYKNKQTRLKREAKEYADNYEIMMRENKLKEVLRNFNIVSYKNEQS